MAVARGALGARVDQVLDNADRALYEAKNNGRNYCVVRALEAGLPTAANAPPAA